MLASYLLLTISKSITWEEGGGQLHNSPALFIFVFSFFHFFILSFFHSHLFILFLCLIGFLLHGTAKRKTDVKVPPKTDYA